MNFINVKSVRIWPLNLRSLVQKKKKKKKSDRRAIMPFLWPRPHLWNGLPGSVRTVDHIWRGSKTNLNLIFLLILPSAFEHIVKGAI